MQMAKCKLQIEASGHKAKWLARMLSSIRNFQFSICSLQFAILLTACASSPLLRAQAPGDMEAPLVGRQEPFCGAVGSGRFQLKMRATPTNLQAGDPLLLTIQIQAVGAWLRAPERPDLLKKPEYAKFRDRFHIENAEDRLSPQEGKWEFDYRLRPKSEWVKEIPSLVIVYFRPGFTPPEKGFMTTNAPAIPLHVTPRPSVSLNEIRGDINGQAAPDRLYEIVTGSEVLRHELPSSLPGWWLMVLAMIGAPMFCLGWYAAWKRRNPDLARMAKLRKSQAARQALRALQEIKPSEPREEVRQVTLVLADYLRHRLDLSSTQPSPGEVNAHLVTKGIPSELAHTAAEIFRACDTIRYAPQVIPNGRKLSQEAVDLVVALEDQS
jgi:hypothetical protein